MRRSEKGRSMVEMLGVLAIIGVLSVGGIYGYTVAMAKYKANEVAQSASMLATMALSKAATGSDVTDYTLTQASLASADAVNTCTPKATTSNNGSKVAVTITCTDEPVKKALSGIVNSGVESNGMTITVAS